MSQTISDSAPGAVLRNPQRTQPKDLSPPIRRKKQANKAGTKEGPTESYLCFHDPIRLVNVPLSHDRRNGELSLDEVEKIII
jgi:hypothetical protein